MYEGAYAQHHTCTDDCINTCVRDEDEGSCHPGKPKGMGASAQSTGHRLWVQPRLLAGWRAHRLGAAPALPFTGSVNSSLQLCLHALANACALEAAWVLTLSPSMPLHLRG